MIELSPQLTALILLGVFLAGVFAGYPLALVAGGTGIIIGFLLFGPMVGQIIYMQIFSIMSDYILLAMPLFIFMGHIVQESGIADRMYHALYLWLGGLRGGLAIASLILATVVATTVGLVAAATTIVTVIAVAPMIKRGYDKALATGCCCAGGSLGILIPPSTLLIIYGPMARLSVGKLYFGAFMPGFLLAALYCLYVAITCYLKPELGPPVPIGERNVPFWKKTWLLATAIVPISVIVLGVLGVIFLGIAAPTEAAATGAFTSMLLAWGYKRLNWKVIVGTVQETIKGSGLIFLIAACSVAYTAVFMRSGSGEIVKNFILSMPFGQWGAFLMVMLICFILGFFIIDLGIIFLLVPIITPIFKSLGFDPIWAAIMVNINIQMSYMTPPLAVAIFFVKGTAPPELGITMADIIRGVWPFVFLIIVGLALCVAFPEIILWLPGKMIQ